MEQFVTIALIGFFSGYQNGEFYKWAKVSGGVLLSTLLMLVLILNLGWDMKLLWLSAIPLIPEIISMSKGKTNRVHLWENWFMYPFYILCFISGVDFIALVLGIIANLFLFNWMIRYYEYYYKIAAFNKGKEKEEQIPTYRKKALTAIWRTKFDKYEIIEGDFLKEVKKKRIFSNGKQMTIAGISAISLYILIQIIYPISFNITDLINLIIK